MFLQKIGPISSGCGQTVAGGSWADSASCSQTMSNVIAVNVNVNVLERLSLREQTLQKTSSLLVVFRISCDLIMRSKIL